MMLTLMIIKYNFFLLALLLLVVSFFLFSEPERNLLHYDKCVI